MNLPLSFLRGVAARASVILFLAVFAVPAEAQMSASGSSKISGEILAHKVRKARPAGVSLNQHTQSIQAAGLNVENLEAEDCALYVANPLSRSEIADLAPEGIVVHETFVPPVPGRHPQGFYLATVAYEALPLIEGDARFTRLDSTEFTAQMNNDQAVVMTHVDQVRSGVGVVPATGAGVKMAIADTGLDLTNTDIPTPVEAYDMTDGSDPSSWGTSVANPATDHGTHVVGIAVGSGAHSGGRYKGVAPDASLYFYKIGSDTDGSANFTDMIEAINRASTVGCKIFSMSFGGVDTYMDGSSSVCQAIDAATAIGMTCFVSAGNMGTEKAHKSMTVPPATTTSVFYYTVSNTASATPYTTGIDIRVIWSDDNNSDANIGLTCVNLDSGEALTLAFSGTSPRGREGKRFTLTPAIAAGASKTYQIQLVNAAASGTNAAVHLFRSSGKGTFDVDDVNSTVLHPGLADTAISVGAWTQRTNWTDYQGASHSYSDLTYDTLSSFSSRGPRIDGLMKPDVVAPGITISTRDSNLTPAAQYILDDDGLNLNGSGPANYVLKRGTSMSCPHAAAIGVLMMEVNPSLTPEQVRLALGRTAHRKGGSRNQVGFGLVDAFEAVRAVTSKVNNPYLQAPDNAGIILWSSEKDFTVTSATQGAGVLSVTHGDILVDLPGYPGEGPGILPGGKNKELVAAFYGDNPVDPQRAISQKGLHDFDVIATTTHTVYIEANAPVTAQMPKVFFSVETTLTATETPALAAAWAPYAVKPGDLLTNSGVVVPNYFLIEPFDFYLDSGLTQPVVAGYEWGQTANGVSIGLDAVDVEGITSSGFDALTTYVLTSSNALPTFNLRNRLNEVNGLKQALNGYAPPTTFTLFFSFEETTPAEPSHGSGSYTQKTYYLGPQHRICDPITGARLPVGTAISDDDLLMIRLPYINWRGLYGSTAGKPDGLVVRAGRDNVPVLGGGDLANLFRDTNKTTEQFPLGLDAVDAPATYAYILGSGVPPTLAPFWSDEAGETGALILRDGLFNYDPCSLAFFSTAQSDINARRTLDDGESSSIFPGPGEKPPLFPFLRFGVDECDLLGSDSPPTYGVPVPPDGLFRGIELNERLIGDHTGASLPTADHVGLDGVDVIPLANLYGPRIDLNGSDPGANCTATFTFGGGAITVPESDATLTDVTNSKLVSLTITLLNAPNGSAESLTATASGGVTVVAYNATTRQLILKGVAPVADYQTVLRTVRYNNTLANPTSNADLVSRNITFTAFDNVCVSHPVQATLLMTTVVPPTQVWADFAHTGTETGSFSQPYNTVAEAVAAVSSGGTIKIKGNTSKNNTTETPRITKAMRIEAINGRVVIGR
jgi:subtilisin family serine protease